MFSQKFKLKKHYENDCIFTVFRTLLPNPVRYRIKRLLIETINNPL